jgi:hypothetical protein
MKNQRKDSPEEKVAILRRHLLEKEPISKLCVVGGYRYRGEPAFVSRKRRVHAAAWSGFPQS